MPWSGVEYKAVEGTQFARTNNHLHSRAHQAAFSQREEGDVVPIDRRGETEGGRGSTLLIYDKHVEEEPICVCAVRIVTILEGGEFV